MSPSSGPGLFRLDGTAAVVTGGGSGIGRAIALAFAEAGADVIVSGRRPEPLERVAQEIRATGRRGVGIAADVTKADHVDRLVTACSEHLGGITSWVNNAGGIAGLGLARLSDMSEADWASTLEVNLTAAWRCSKAVSQLLPDGGSILNLTSVGALTPPAPGAGAYGVAKAGLQYLTTALAHELAPRVRVNAIAPSFVATEGTDMSEEHLASLARRHPLKRVGQGQDCAAAAVYLTSNAASWITGHTMVVSGGLLMR